MGLRESLTAFIIERVVVPICPIRAIYSVAGGSSCRYGLEKSGLWSSAFRMAWRRRRHACAGCKEIVGTTTSPSLMNHRISSLCEAISVLCRVVELFDLVTVTLSWSISLIPLTISRGHRVLKAGGIHLSHANSRGDSTACASRSDYEAKLHICGCRRKRMYSNSSRQIP